MAKPTDVKTIFKPEVVREGIKIILPSEEKMTLEDVIDSLKGLLEFEKQEVQIVETIEAFPWDGAYALFKVMEEEYGYAKQVPIQTFFGDQPPALISVECAPGQFVNVPWGRLVLPGVKGFIETGVAAEPGKAMKFQIQATVRRMYESNIKSLAAKTRAYLQHNSIYRGQAIKIRFTNEENQVLKVNQITPKFLDLSKTHEEELRFSEQLHQEIEDYFFTYVDYRKEALSLGLPGKRGLLFEGKPGTGKTMTMMVGAKKATKKGITVVYCENSNDFEKVTKFALQYAPAMVVCEDIDRITAGERNLSIDRILNILDGIETKHQDLMIVFTSNNVDEIQQAMLRPGRIDVCIHFDPPDAQAAEALVRLYSAGLLKAGEDLTEVGRSLEGQIPAVIREVVERSKLSALRRSGGNPNHLMLVAKDITVASNSIHNQLALLNRETPKEVHPLIAAAQVHEKGHRAIAEALNGAWTHGSGNGSMTKGKEVKGGTDRARA